MAVTINDVAREAGVSISTVSRVLNNNYPVKKETRIKIEKAIEKLNYKPNAAARSLITKKSSMIGVIVPGITNLFFPTIVEAVEEFIKDKGYNILLCNTAGDPVREKEVVQGLSSKGADGIIAIDPTIENLKNRYLEKENIHIPILIVNGCPRGNKCNFVCYDEKSGALKAFKYLRKLKHEKIAFIRGNRSFSYDIKEDLYNEVIKKEKLNYKKVLNVGEGNSIEVVQKTQKKAFALLSSDNPPTAIVACNDLMALGVINACNILGLNVPEDLSVIGCDNTLLSNISHPKLTSIDLNMKEIGHRAALEMLDIIENESKIVKKIIINTNLIIRESCEMAK